MPVDRFPAMAKRLQKRTESVCYAGQTTTDGRTQRKSFHQLDRQLHTFRNLSRKQSPSNLFLNMESRVRWLLTLVAVQPWHCSGIFRSVPLAVLSFLAALRAIVRTHR